MIKSITTAPLRRAQMAANEANEARDEAMGCDQDVEDAQAALQRVKERAALAHEKLAQARKDEAEAQQEADNAHFDESQLDDDIKGAWVKKRSKRHHRDYYYNQVTTGVTWDVPEGFEVICHFSLKIRLCDE